MTSVIKTTQDNQNEAGTRGRGPFTLKLSSIRLVRLQFLFMTSDNPQNLQSARKRTEYPPHASPPSTNIRRILGENFINTRACSRILIDLAQLPIPLVHDRLRLYERLRCQIARNSPQVPTQARFPPSPRE